MEGLQFWCELLDSQVWNELLACLCVNGKAATIALVQTSFLAHVLCLVQWEGELSFDEDSGLP